VIPDIAVHLYKPCLWWIPVDWAPVTRSSTKRCSTGQILASLSPC